MMKNALVRVREYSAKAQKAQRPVRIPLRIAVQYLSVCEPNKFLIRSQILYKRSSVPNSGGCLSEGIKNQ